MASAGRILILPKGNYDPSVTYEMLDLVFYDGASWVAKRTVTGIAPVNGDDWMKMCESMDLTEILQRIAALESQMLGTISLDDLDDRLDVLEPDIETLKGNVSTLQENMSELLTTPPNFEIVSYVGDGTYGSNNPCSLTFNRPPKIIIYLGNYLSYTAETSTNSGTHSAGAKGQDYSEKIIFCEYLATEYRYTMGFKEADESTSFVNTNAKKSADGKTIYWYVSGGDNSSLQLNDKNKTYYFVAIY